MIVRNWMQQNPTLVDGDTLLAEAKRILTEHNLQALPVIEGGRLRGMVTRQHCLRAAHFVSRTQNPDEYHFFANRLKPLIHGQAVHFHICTHGFFSQDVLFLYASTEVRDKRREHGHIHQFYAP